jgi:hypothetical protein
MRNAMTMTGIQSATHVSNRMMNLRRTVFHWLIAKLGAKRSYYHSASARRKELTGQLFRLCHGRVLAGPFAGMMLPDHSSWGDGDVAPKLLGTYEANLHRSLLEAVRHRPSTVVNVGCAEGYFAVGLAQLLPQAEVYAFDVDTGAGEICRRAAEINGVSDRVRVGGLCTVAVLADLLRRSRRTLVFMDCEGAERDLLDPQLVPGLAACDLLVETHETLAPGVTALLEQRFEASHKVERIIQGGRDPNGFSELRNWPELDRWLLVDEARPHGMTWLACWAERAEARRS